MILQLAEKYRKATAFVLMTIFYTDVVLATYVKTTGSCAPGIGNSIVRQGSHMPNPAFTGRPPQRTVKPQFPVQQVKKQQPAITTVLNSSGPSQPEMQSFQPVNSNNMVDLFTGDFSYNIPLVDVGGYPINIAYKSGITMDQEASWVGLGWNINPGTITRDMRGVPDDFNGNADTVRKVSSIKDNVTVGVTAGANVELFGKSLEKQQTDTSSFSKLGFGAHVGVFHNNYRGWGSEFNVNASLNSGRNAQGPLTGGLSLTSNSQEGVTIAPSLSVALSRLDEKGKGGGATFGSSFAYNTRAGIRSMQLDMSAFYQRAQKNYSTGQIGGNISFLSPAYTPTINLPYTSKQVTFTAKVGTELWGLHANLFVSGYVSTQTIKNADTSLSLPVFGYLNFQGSNTNRSALLDFNREKDIVYRDKPAEPNIAVPAYTYDVFSMTGEGTGGMFRAYRGDIGFVYDHTMQTKDASGALSVDIGVGQIAHNGVDLNVNRAYTQNGPWLNNNNLGTAIPFQDSHGTYEAAYFRNPGEKAINSAAFYNAVGGDDLVTVALKQNGNGDPNITALSSFNRYKGGNLYDNMPLTNAVKSTRDKRTQVISYLTAQEASVTGLSKYIDIYTPNKFGFSGCTPVPDVVNVRGLWGQYYRGDHPVGTPVLRMDTALNFKDKYELKPTPDFPESHYSVRWLGRLLAPVSGTYNFRLEGDDVLDFSINDSSIGSANRKNPKLFSLNLVGGVYYNIKAEFWQNDGDAWARVFWQYPGLKDLIPVPAAYWYQPDTTTIYQLDSVRTKEKRVTRFRRGNHISEIDVVNADGRRYVYGIPVYNLSQKELTFSLNRNDGTPNTGLAHYDHGVDNTTNNGKGKDNYFSKEEIPAYAHSFLLTGILSPDYVDLTGDGISDDDPGDAIKFNYSRLCSVFNPYGWRAPYAPDSVTYNEGMRTDNSDDKGSYIYGEKELWYLHSIESKNMIATFTVEDRKDGLAINERGQKYSSNAKRLKQIDLYTKADLLKNKDNAIPIKTVHFAYSYRLCRGYNRGVNDSGKLTLDSIWFTYNGNDKGRLNPYVFNYHANNPSYRIGASDKWGTYKDAAQNPGNNGSNYISNAEYPYALQDSSTAACNAAAWTLNKIKLPSGGSISVDYESDDYAYVQDKRAMNLFKLVGFSLDGNLPPGNANSLYDNNGNDALYVFAQVTDKVHSKQEVLQKYLQGLTTLYFKLNVYMPADVYGSGSEYIPCYADILQSGCDRVNDSIIRIQLKGINATGDNTGVYSPLSKAALQFLRINLPSKAYPGSDYGDDPSVGHAVSALLTMFTGLGDIFTTFEGKARSKNYARYIDTSRSFVRLNNPVYRKLGGGLRVKRITISDNWNAMTKQKEATYGQEYIYTTTEVINGVPTVISSGVASYEPAMGGDENPFHLPLEYNEKLAPLAPTAMGYTEKPLGETFYPSAGIGYSKVRVRTIHARNVKSANGFEETNFYTARDFPTISDFTQLDGTNKKHYNPTLANFLRINSKHYLGMSQGFKIELNDMHGKVKSQATYPETDSANPISYTETFYKVDNQQASQKHLSNTVTVIDPSGAIDTAATIGKDIELMMDMREQRSVTNANNLELNTDMFSAGIIPLIIPTALGIAQREENLYHSVATTKVIQRYGIVDSVVHIEKGSKITTENLLFDSETGDVLLTKTQNEFNDPVYNFTYPTHWAYDGMGEAYRNIGATVSHVQIKDGKIVGGLPFIGADTLFFASGDELLVSSKQGVGKTIDTCQDKYATFPDSTRLWAINSNVLKGGRKAIYFVDKDGNAFSGYDVSLKVIRSGRRNINGSVGEVTTLKNPLVKVGNQYQLLLNTDSKVVTASAAEYREFWQVSEPHLQKTVHNCVPVPLPDCNGSDCNCNCLAPLFSYLINSGRLFTNAYDSVMVSTLVQQANAAGYSVSSACPVIALNLNKQFYALTFDSLATSYQARIGDAVVQISMSTPVNYPFTSLVTAPCDAAGKVNFKYPSSTANITQRLYMVQSMEHFFDHNDTLPKLRVGTVPGMHVDSYFRFDSIQVSSASDIVQASMHLFAAPDGFNPPGITSASSIIRPQDPSNMKLVIPGFQWNTQTADTSMHTWFDLPNNEIRPGSVFYNYSADVTDAVKAQYDSSGNHTGFALIDETSACLVSANQYYAAFCSQSYPDLLTRPYLDITYRKAHDPNEIVATLQVILYERCDSVASQVCYNPVLDTVMNPYVFGLLGNFRSNKSYTYFGRRAESDPTQPTNIRINGAYNDFAPFWHFTSAGFTQQYDTTRWVWNSELTKFNSKGFELENKDALGRYNAGLYGYNITLPTAVVQNAQYNESAFEGFEDYDFNQGSCAADCPANRHFDFSAVRDKITSAQSHTGKYSILVHPGDAVGVSALIASPADTATSGLNIVTANTACSLTGPVLKSVKATNGVLLPVFSPVAGKKIVVSAWAKEGPDSLYKNYSNNQVAVSFTVNGSSQSVVLHPSGNLIESWQRYEGFVDVPLNATDVSINLMATGNVPVYFDDIRVHPFNANMKSFVYDPVSLRLMAELDENNYATFYEYDDDGTLIRVKKETERGVKTIKETRNALLKQELSN